MTDDALARDAADRARALELASFLCEAPAGAGKTELLTQRFLRLLTTVDDPEEVVAITFTRKAAGEMRERIVGALVAAQAGVLPDAPHKQVTFRLAQAVRARDRDLGWQLDARPGRLRLTTIDALCASLARQMPLLSRLGAQPALVDDAGRHYADAAQRALAHLDQDSPHADDIAVVLRYFDNDAARVGTLVADMLARRDHWGEMYAAADPQADIAATLREVIDSDLHALAQVLDGPWQRRWMPLARFAAARLGGGELLDWSEPLAAASVALPKWRALARLVLTGTDTVRAKVTIREGFPADVEYRAQKNDVMAELARVTAAQAAALARARQLPAPGHQDDALVRALVRVLHLAAAELWLVFREAGEVDFVELAARAIDALGEADVPTDLALRLDYRIRHLLVDEFQDTSPAQIRLLERLTAGWQPDDGRTLFVVGDPMQSIYRFRRADVGLFLRARDAGIGALPLARLCLTRNNRSAPPVVEWINATFPDVLAGADDAYRGQIAYRPFVATRGDLPGAGVHIHPVALGSEADGDVVRAAEAAMVVDLIEREWADDPARQIAVLVRSRKHLGGVATALRQRHPDWRFAAVEVEPLLGRQPVQDVLAIIRALHHRGDRVNWLAVLRAPWCGLTLADLHALAADAHGVTVWSLINDTLRVARLSPDGQARLAPVRAVFAEALAGQGRQGRRRWVEDVWRQLGGPQITNASGRADVAALLDRIERLDRDGRFALDRLDDDLADLYAPPDAGADRPLQLMTMHKAKGLEFDTVILPGLAHGTRRSDGGLLLWDSVATPHGERLLVAARNRRGAGDEPTAYDYLAQMEKARDRNEAARLLYVAATRTVRRLHLVATVACKAGEGPQPPAGDTLLALLWPQVADRFAAAAPAAALVADRCDGFDGPLVRLSCPLEPPLPAPPPLAVADDATGDALAAAIGSLVHACLEQMALDAPWAPASLPARRPALGRWLAARGWPQGDAMRGADAALAMLETCLGSADGQWVLAAHDEAAAELALANFSRGGAAVTRVVDRTFVADGMRWIVDYKTARVGGAGEAAPDAAALRRHAERYREQLAGYAELFADEGRPVRQAILYVAHGMLVAVD